MNDLERNLLECQKPHIEVPRFKQRLLRDLTRGKATNPQPGRFYRFAFAGAVGLAGTLATLLVLFVLKPELPAGLNARITSQEEPGRATLTQTEEASWNQPEGTVLTGTRAIPFPSLEADREIIRRWAPGNFNEQLHSLSPAGEKVLTIREFLLPGGKRMWIYSEVAPSDSGQKAALPVKEIY